MDDVSQAAPWLNVMILHWEDAAALAQCLTRLAQSDYPRLRVLVIENGSSPKQREEARLLTQQAQDHFPWVHFLQNESNLGYVGGNNAGLTFLNYRQLSGDLCILNPDVTVGRSTLSSMVRVRKPKVGLVMCSAVSETGAALYDCFLLHGFRQTSARSTLPVIASDYAQGACLLVSRDLAATALFDARFFLYWEEVELSLRARKAGWQVVSCTTAPVTRQQNKLARLPTAIYYSARNAWLLKDKFPQDFTLLGYGQYICWLALLTAKLCVKPKLFFAAWHSLAAALRDARFNRYGMRKARSSTATRSYTPTEEVLL